MSEAATPETHAGGTADTGARSDGARSDGDKSPGSGIITVDAVSTAIFAATAMYGAAVFDSTAQWVSSITAMALFSIGVVAFMWSFAIALQRSRTEHLSVAEVYLLMGRAIPTDVKRKMNLLIVAQFAIALGTSLWRPQGPNGAPGSALVVGFLVPMLGFGLNGVWATRHGRFDPRSEPGSQRAKHEQVSTTSNPEIRQNAKHG